MATASLDLLDLTTLTTEELAALITWVVAGRVPPRSGAGPAELLGELANMVPQPPGALGLSLRMALARLEEALQTMVTTRTLQQT